MATKSKKSAIIKTVCFLLALIFVFTGFLTGYNFLVTVMDSARTESGRYLYYAAQDCVSDYLQFGKDFRLTESDMFYREKEKFISTAISSSVVFGDGSKKAYEAYRKSVEQAAKESIVDDLQGLSYYSFFDRYFQGCFRLEKIGDCSLKYHGQLFDYVEGFIDADDEDYDETTRIENTTMYYDSSVKVPTTMYGETYYRDDESGRYNNIETNVPDSLKKKLPDGCDATVYICNAQCDGEYFDGWYALTVDTDRAVTYWRDNSGFAEYNSYSYFSNSSQRAKNALSEYKNMFFALYNKKTGEIITNFPEKLDEKTVEKAFLAHDYNASFDFGSGEWTNGKGVPEDSRSVIDFSYSDYKADRALLGDYRMYLAFDETLSGGEDAFSSIPKNYESFSSSANAAFAVVIICLLGFIACTVVLVVTAGRNGVDGQVHMMKTDKIFTLLRIAINGGLICGLIWLGTLFVGAAIDERCVGFFGRNQPGAILLSLLAGLIAALIIDLLMYLSRHIKNHTLLKNLFIVWLFGKIAGPIKKYKAKREAQPPVYRDIVKDVTRKAGLYLVLPNVIGILLILLLNDVALLALPILFALLVFALLGYDVYCVIYAFRYFTSLRKIFYALNEIRNGNYNVTVDTAGMNGTVKKYAEDVNALRDGLKVAVENAVREQRTKTELITNVSHDLKTPLTSIINYTDLLSRCDIQDETARGYIEVLGEKSARLKKLIEDLVEASKASTGSINVELIQVSLNELTRQLCGEYSDEFESRNLKLVFDEKAEDVLILADSKLCYRVLDNLFCNVKKYAMPGTRVYVTVSKGTQSGDITLRNVSENALNIPASELTARFVRGDESRSSEGSGLGLSIAKSLTELQGGTLALDIAGDTFTASVSFRLA